MMRGKTKIQAEVNVGFRIKRELHDQLSEHRYLTGESIRGICIKAIHSSVKDLEKERNKKYKK